MSNLFETAFEARQKLDNLIRKKSDQVKAEPHNPSPYVELGNLYKQVGKTGAAFSQFQKALAINPEYFPAFNALALVHAAKKEYEQSINFFKKALAVNPDQHDVYYNIACIYARQDKVKEAIDWLRQAIENGYDNWDLIRTDRDLENIRGNIDYMKLQHRQSSKP